MVAPASGELLRIRFFPARISGVCALCSGTYSRLDMVGFFPHGAISHHGCIVAPPKIAPAKPVDPEGLQFLSRRIAKAINPGVEPFPFQVEAVDFVERHRGRALIADQMGLGKTISTLCWLAVHPETRPAVIVCPNSVKLNWPREIVRWLPDTPENTVAVLSGTAPTKLPEAGVYVINYDITKHWLPLLQKRGVRAVVCDEVHYVKNPKAQRTRAIVGAGSKAKTPYLLENVPNFVGLSGTPMTNRPVELWPAVHAIKRDVFRNYWDYAREFCNAHKRWIGRREVWDVSGAGNIQRLHKLLAEHVMIRREKTDVLKQLPAKTRSVIPVEIANRPEYRRAERDFIGWLREQGASPGKLSRAQRAEALVKINGLKRLAARGKLDAIVEWVNDFMVGENKLVIFAYHNSYVEALREALKEHNPVTAFKNDAPKQLQAAVDAFQTNPDTRIFIGGIKKASEGITLHAASDVLICELPWTPALLDQAEDRIHRIGQEKPCTAYYLLSAGTVEEQVSRLIDEKRGVIAGVLDNRVVATGEAIFNGLLGAMAGAR